MLVHLFKSHYETVRSADLLFKDITYNKWNLSTAKFKLYTIIHGRKTATTMQPIMIQGLSSKHLKQQTERNTK